MCYLRFCCCGCCLYYWCSRRRCWGSLFSLGLVSLSRYWGEKQSEYYSVLGIIELLFDSLLNWSSNVMSPNETQNTLRIGREAVLEVYDQPRYCFLSWCRPIWMLTSSSWPAAVADDLNRRLKESTEHFSLLKGKCKRKRNTCTRIFCSRSHGVEISRVTFYFLLGEAWFYMRY